MAEETKSKVMERMEFIRSSVGKFTALMLGLVSALAARGAK